MERLLGTYALYLYALMRIVLGVLFACHGAQKLFGVLGGTTVAPFPQGPRRDHRICRRVAGRRGIPHQLCRFYRQR